jgi:hypothetical protein
MLKPSRKYYLDITFGLVILVHLLETTMHAIVAIFGVGVGVGLILGDSFRATVSGNMDHETYESNHNASSAGSPSCQRSATNIDLRRSDRPLATSDPLVLGGLPPQ